MGTWTRLTGSEQSPGCFGQRNGLSAFKGAEHIHYTYDNQFLSKGSSLKEDTSN